MKNLTLMFLLFATFSFSQEIIRPASEYYSADSIRNRTDMNRASADAVKKWKDSGFIEMEVKLYQPTLLYRFPKIDMSVPDTVFVGADLTESYKDTTVWGWSKVRLNKLKEIVFTHRTKLGGYDYETFNLKVLDTTIFKPCPQTDFCERDSMQFNIRKYYEGKYLVKAEEIEKPIDTTFRIVGSYIRSSSEDGMTIHTYATEDWIYNYKSSDTYNPITKKCENWQPQWNRVPDYQAGNPKNETHYNVVYPSLWRHTTRPTRANTKCFKIGIENKITGIIRESQTHVNPDI